jgi:hypothetical protein
MPELGGGTLTVLHTDVEESTPLRVGIHAGDVECDDGPIGGITVNTGSRIMGAAQPGEVLVSNTVKDPMAGSGITFTNRGTHVLTDSRGSGASLLRKCRTSGLRRHRSPRKEMESKLVISHLRRNNMFERTAGSHALAAAAQRECCMD